MNIKKMKQTIAEAFERERKAEAKKLPVNSSAFYHIHQFFVLGSML